MSQPPAESKDIVAADAASRRLSPLGLGEVAVLGGLIIWLLVAALVFEVEYYDGIDSVCNAMGFAGTGQDYIVNRAPLMPLLLTPAAALHAAIEMDPFDFRPYHLTTAALHAGYLVLCYVLIARWRGRDGATLLAFVAAVPCFIWLAYAPFISHDILPGVMLLGMVLLAQRFLTQPTWGAWAALVALGAAAPLTKHVFALFWAALVIVHLALILWLDRKERATMLKRWAMLFGGAVASAAITWLVLAAALERLGMTEAGTYWQRQDIPWIMRPWTQVRFLFAFASPGEEWVRWVYLRNFGAYGIVAALLILPGLVMALRGARLLKAAALTWIILLAIHVFMEHQEVRYLLFLAPLTAALIVEPMRWVLRRRAFALAVVALLVASALPAWPWPLLPEVTRVAQPYYTHGQMRELLTPLYADGQRREPVMCRFDMLSFTPPGNNPLPGDRFFRLHHLGAHHLRILLDYTPQTMARVTYSTAPQDAMIDGWAAGTWLIHSNIPLLVNPVVPESTPPMGYTELIQIVGSPVDLPLQRGADGVWRSPDGAPLRYAATTFHGQPALIIENHQIASMLGQVAMPRLSFGPGQQGWVIDAGPRPGTFIAIGLDAMPVPPEGQPLLIRAFNIERIHSYMLDQPGSTPLPSP